MLERACGAHGFICRGSWRQGSDSSVLESVKIIVLFAHVVRSILEGLESNAVVLSGHGREENERETTRRSQKTRRM